MPKRRIKMSNGLWVFLSVFLVVGMLFAFGVPQKVGEGGFGGDKDEQCLSTTSPNLSIFAVDKETGTALTEGTNLYRVEGRTSWSTFTAGTGFAVGAGKDIEIVMGISTTDFTDNAYGQHIEKYTVPCEETPEVEYEMANDEVYTSLSATFYNEDDNAAAQTFTAGQVKDVSIKLQAGVDEYFGNPYLEGNANVICLGLNSTEWDTPQKVSIKGGSELSIATTPKNQDSGTGITEYCYDLPVINEDSVSIVFKLDADDSVDPITDMTASMYAANYFYNSKTQEIESGVENQEGTAVGAAAADTIVFDFTA